MISRAHRRLSTALLVAALMLTSASIAAVHATPSIAPSITFGTEAVDLSNENRTSSINDVHAIAASGSNVYVTWVAGAVFFKASHDNGSSWGSVVKLTVSTGKVSLQKLAADGLNVYVVYLETILGLGKVYVRASHDGGVTFNPAFQISDFPPRGWDSIEPKIATCAGGVYVAWINSTGRAQGNLGAPETNFFRASQDGGNTWGPVINLQADDGVNPPARGNEEEVECWKNNVHVVYSDYALGFREVFIRSSHDKGVTFAPHVDISTIPLGKGNIREPVVAVGGSYVYVYWIYRSSGASNYQAFVRVSPDNGTTWGAKVNVCADTNNCHEPFMAANGPNGYIILHEFVSTAVTKLYVRATHDGGVTWDPKIDLIPNEQFKSSFGSISTSGSWVFVAWSDRETNGNWEMKFAASNDFGNTFTPTQNISNNSGDSGVIHFGHCERAIASSNNHVYAIWEDTTTVNGKADIFFNAGQFA